MYQKSQEYWRYHMSSEMLAKMIHPTANAADIERMAVKAVLAADVLIGKLARYKELPKIDKGAFETTHVKSFEEVTDAEHAASIRDSADLAQDIAIATNGGGTKLSAESVAKGLADHFIRTGQMG
jgi:hypothetical protein